MNMTLLFVLRLLHILAGIFWVGGILIVAGFILPSVRALGPGGLPMMSQLAQVRKLPLRLLLAGWVTVLSGAVLYWRAGSSFGNTWPGRVFGVGGAIAILVILMGTFGNLPTSRRMTALGAQMQAASGGTPEQTAEMQRLQMRLRRLTEIAAVLLMLTAACMAVARYT